MRRRFAPEYGEDKKMRKIVAEQEQFAHNVIEKHGDEWPTNLFTGHYKMVPQKNNTWHGNRAGAKNQIVAKIPVGDALNDGILLATDKDIHDAIYGAMNVYVWQAVRYGDGSVERKPIFSYAAGTISKSMKVPRRCVLVDHRAKKEHRGDLSAPKIYKMIVDLKNSRNDIFVTVF